MHKFRNTEIGKATVGRTNVRSRNPLPQAAVWAAFLITGLTTGRVGAETPPLRLTDLTVTSAASWPNGTATIALGGGIEVTVARLDEYLAQKPNVHLKDFVLFLDSRPLPGLWVRRASIAGDGKDKLLFDLRSVGEQEGKQSNQTEWNQLLGSPPFCLGCRKNVSVTVGIGNEPLDSSERINLVLVPAMWGGIGIAVVALMSIGLLVISYQSNVLCDPLPDPATGRRKYSLSRVQMAVWFWAIFTSYVFIWVINGETASLTGQVLGILGISSATLAGSALMDAKPSAPGNAPAGGTNQPPAGTLTGTTTLTPGPAAPPAAPNPLVAPAAAPIRAQNSPVPFFIDILSDQSGVSLPRFQALAWTVVMIGIFLSTVWQTIYMPEFDGYLLTLMGLSSGTYVGMKANEEKTG